MVSPTKNVHYTVLYYSDRCLMKKAVSLETACTFARGVVVELLTQGQMTGLCT